MAAKIELEKCEGCGDCVEDCPTTSISIVDGKAVVVEDECIDCQMCMDHCKQGAIEMG